AHTEAIERARQGRIDRHDDDWDGVATGLIDVALHKVPAMHDWHEQVEDYDIRPHGVQHAQGFSAIRGGLYEETAVLEDVADDFADRFLILDDEHEASV